MNWLTWKEIPASGFTRSWTFSSSSLIKYILLASDSFSVLQFIHLCPRRILFNYSSAPIRLSMAAKLIRVLSILVTCLICTQWNAHITSYAPHKILLIHMCPSNNLKPKLKRSAQELSYNVWLCWVTQLLKPIRSDCSKGEKWPVQEIRLP